MRAYDTTAIPAVHRDPPLLRTTGLGALSAPALTADEASILAAWEISGIGLNLSDYLREIGRADLLASPAIASKIANVARYQFPPGRAPGESGSPVPSAVPARISPAPADMTAPRTVADVRQAIKDSKAPAVPSMMRTDVVSHVDAARSYVNAHPATTPQELLAYGYDITLAQAQGLVADSRARSAERNGLAFVTAPGGVVVGVAASGERTEDVAPAAIVVPPVDPVPAADHTVADGGIMALVATLGYLFAL